MKAVLLDLYRFRSFIAYSFLKNIKSSSRNNLLGWLWVIVMPLIPICLYIFLQEIGFLKSSNQMARSFYVVFGITFWEVFSDSTLKVMSAPVDNRDILKKKKIPFFPIYIAALGQPFLIFLIRLPLMYFLAFKFSALSPFALLLLPLTFLPFAGIGLALGMFLSVFYCYIRDIKNVLAIFFKYMMFLSGVIIPVPSVFQGLKFLELNFIYILIDNIRLYLFNGQGSFRLTFVILFFLGLGISTIFLAYKVSIEEGNLRERL